MLENYLYKIIGAKVKGKDKRALVIEGIDFGYANPSYKGLPIIREKEHHFLCRIRGTVGRYSLGTFGYHPPRYIIFTKHLTNMIKNPLGDWELEYTKETAKQAKWTALEELDRREKK